MKRYYLWTNSDISPYYVIRQEDGKWIWVWVEMSEETAGSDPFPTRWEALRDAASDILDNGMNTRSERSLAQRLRLNATIAEKKAAVTGE